MAEERVGAENPTLRQFLGVLREQRLVIVITMAVAVAAALLYSGLKDPEYTADASVSFTDQSQDLLLLGTPAAPSFQPEKAAAAGAENVTRQAVAAAVKRSLGTPLSTQELTSRIETNLEPETNLVVIKATSGDAEFTSRLANVFAEQTKAVVTREQRDELRDAAKDLRGQLPRAPDVQGQPSAGETARLGERATLNDRIARLESLATFANPVEITRLAQTPDDPSSPKPIRDTLLAAVLGLLLGVLLAFLRASLDRRLLSSRQAEQELDLPVVAHVRSEALGFADGASNGRDKLAEADLDAFRILRLNVRFLDVDTPPQAILVTSAMPQEGKSTVAASLAYANALTGKSTLLVETDLRRPSVSSKLGLKDRPGLTDYLIGSATPQEILQPVTIGLTPSVEQAEARSAKPGPMVCITAGSPFPRPTELLASDRMRTFVSSVSGAYEMVVFDSPPLLPVGDTLELIPLVDAVLLCVREGVTTQDQAQAAKSTLGHMPPRPTGLVVTGVTPGSDSEYGYYSYAYVGDDRPAKPTSHAGTD